MRTERVDVVIIGAGLAGSAAASALAGRGRSVAVVEAFAPGHRRGSSHGSARIFRRAYPDPLYVRLTGQAQQLWRR
jgi:sarcosine oxidase